MACSLYELGDKTVCSICGEYGEEIFAAVEAGIKAVDYNALPQYGELIARMLENPAADTAYGFTVAWESAGKEIPFSGVVSVSLPLQAEGQYKLMQNGAEIPFTLENGMLTFETKEAGLFLLILQQ